MVGLSAMAGRPFVLRRHPRWTKESAVAVRKPPDPALEVAAMIDRAWVFLQRKRGDEAWHLLLKAERAAKTAGLRSAFLAWVLAVAADLRGDAERAVKYIVEAVELEPCASAIRGSFDIIVRRTQVSLADLPAWDPEVSRLFVLLQKLDAVDAAASEKYSLHTLAHGDPVTSLAWAEEAVRLDLPTPQRLRHLARLLAHVGRHDDARARLEEADALAMTFPCPQAQA
jgi:Flp pilus assembly protein TadD